MRLIYADKFCEYVDEYCNDNIAVFWKELIRRQPTAYDVDGVVRELEKEYLGKPTPEEFNNGIIKAIEIVRGSQGVSEG